MGLFGRKIIPGLSDYELHEHSNRLLNRLHGCLQGSRATREHKQDILDAALMMTGDRDYGMSHTQKSGVVTAEEFEQVLKHYVAEKIFTEEEATCLLAATEEAMKD